ncbi:MAG TPA: OmpA family protein [Stellaceae bacterium]|nr:OmpA family protein [Stellaceae bacterium]
MIGRAAALALLMALAACGLPRNLVVLIPDESGATGKAIVSGGGRQAELDQPFALVETNPGEAPGKVAIAKKEQVEDVFAGALAATPPAPVIFRVFFANAQANLDAKARATIDAAIAAAKASSLVNISVVGHTDAIGNNATENLPLSLRRAETVRDALVAAGIPRAVIDIAYFGANHPFVPNKPGVPEPLNRRVEITIR